MKVFAGIMMLPFKESVIVLPDYNSANRQAIRARPGIRARGAASVT
jgi:hypothetical protein